MDVYVRSEFESKENIYSCHYIAWDALTVKLAQLIQTEEKEISMQSSRVCTSVHRARGQCKWNVQHQSERNLHYFTFIEHIAALLLRHWRMNTEKYRISFYNMALDLISLFGFFRALRCAFACTALGKAK